MRDRSDLAACYVVDGERVLPTPHAAGPWSAAAQHGGAPAGLLGWAIERLPSREPMQLARLTVDLLRPAPLVPLTLRAQIVREGRKILVCAFELLEGEKAVAQASALLVRASEAAAGCTLLPLDVPLPRACPAADGAEHLSSPFVLGVEKRLARGDLAAPGPAAVWYRLPRPIVSGHALTPLVRAAATADFGNGTSAVLDPAAWTFINGDLTLSLARPPVGEWILVDAESWIGPSGRGLASARLADVEGYFGRAAQSLLVEPRDSHSDTAPAAAPPQAAL